MKNEKFFQWYDSTAAPLLGRREQSFRIVFEYLDQLQGPLSIVETGCLRQADNWNGDGQSTLLFDKYVSSRDAASIVHTVDLDPAATSACRSLVSDRVHVHTGDSVLVLRSIIRTLAEQGKKIDFLYLDSYDLDWSNPTPSAVHHLKELVSSVAALSPHSLVVVDDAPLDCRLLSDFKGGFSLFSPPTVGGKGKYVAEYAIQVGATPLFMSYQAGWTGMV